MVFCVHQILDLLYNIVKLECFYVLQFFILKSCYILNWVQSAFTLLSTFDWNNLITKGFTWICWNFEKELTDYTESINHVGVVLLMLRIYPKPNGYSNIERWPCYLQFYIPVYTCLCNFRGTCTLETMMLKFTSVKCPC